MGALLAAISQLKRLRISDCGLRIRPSNNPQFTIGNPQCAAVLKQVLGRSCVSRNRYGRALVLVAALSLMGSVAARGAEQQPARAPQPGQYDAKNRRDPFVALVQGGRVTGASPRVPIENAKPVLYGILWDSGGQSIALINDQEAKVGDTIDGYRVKEIRQDAVVLESEGGPIELRIAFDAPSSASTGAPRNAAKGGAKP